MSQTKVALGYLTHAPGDLENGHIVKENGDVGVLVDGSFSAATAAIADVTASAAEINVLDGVTAGTVLASGGVVVDSNKDIGDFRNLDCVNLDAGASGTAGTVDIFPTTASKGKTAITATDNSGNTTTTINTAAQAGARTYTVPDAGASCSFLMGRLTLEAHTSGDTLTAAESGSIHTNAGASGAVTLVLPSAVVGLFFIFYVQAAQELRLDPAGSETIALPSTGAQSAAGKYITADAAGEYVQVVCTLAGQWEVMSYRGTWAAES